jgi:hypothetical protein
VLTVNYGEGAARAKGFLRELGLELPVILDRDHRIARAWGVGGLPTSFLVGADGRVRSWVFGECDWGRGEAAAELARLLAEANGARRAKAGGARRELAR